MQYAIENWLLEPGEGYYSTDLAKCTVLVEVAQATRRKRYEQCSAFFNREVDFLKPRAIITIGLDDYRYLKKHRSTHSPPIVSLLHFSRTAVRYRKKLLAGDWETQVPSLPQLEALALSRRLPIHHGKPTGIRNSHRELLGAYRTQLGVVRQILDGRLVARHAAMVHVASG